MFSTKFRRIASIALGVAGVTALVAGGAVAITPPGTEATFIPVNHRVLNAASIGINHASSPVVVGGSTTVPTDATTVRLLVSVKSTGAGSLEIYPSGDSSGARDDTVSWSGAKGGLGEVYENPGTSNEVTFVNHSTRTISLTVTISGYTSKQTVYYSGPVSATIPNLSEPSTMQISFTVPAGTYLIDATGTVGYGSSDATVICSLVDGNTLGDLNTAWVDVTTSTADVALAVQGIITLDLAGTVALRCAGGGHAQLVDAVVTATPVGVAHQG